MKKSETNVDTEVNTEQIIKCCRDKNNTLMIRFKTIMAMSPERRREMEGEACIKWLDSPAARAVQECVEK